MFKNLNHKKILRGLLLFGSLYMGLEAVIHLTLIRTIGLEQFWPLPAIILVQEFMALWGIASAVIAFVLFKVSQDIHKYKDIIFFLATLGIIHTFVLVYLSTNSYNTLLPTTISVLWIPNYQAWLFSQAMLLLIACLYIKWIQRRRLLDS